MRDEKLSPEEEKVTQIVNDAQDRTKANQEQIKNTPSDKGPQLTPQDPMVSANIPGSKRQSTERLNNDISATRENALNDTAASIKGSPIDKQAKAYSIADDFAYPETSRQNDPSLNRGKEKDLDETQRSFMHKLGRNPEMEDRTSKVKTDISESQDFAMRKIADQKEKNEQPQPPTGNGFKGASMSQRFNMSLGYSNMEKAAEMGKEKTEPAKMSMSEKFSGSLESQNPEKSSQSESKESKTIEIDKS